jgi:hypothetical protein
MAIANYNKRVIITLPIELHEAVEAKAKEENRSISNMVTTILMKELGITPNKYGIRIPKIDIRKTDK